MTNILIVLALVLGVLAIAQLARVYELTSRLRGKREEDISPGDNRLNAALWWVFMVVYYIFFFWLFFRYRDRMLPISGSEHGEALDKLLNFNWIILFIAFFITNTLLFWFAGKYYFRQGRRAFYYPHNNKLELLWTVVPAAVLAVIIIYGLRTWNEITEPGTGDMEVVELYAKQFDWTARYPGKDGMLGATDFRLINGTNPLGVVTRETVATRMQELADELAEIEERLANEVLPDDQVAELHDRTAYLQRMRGRITDLRTEMEQDIAEKGEASPYLAGADDLVIKEFHLPLRKEAKLLIRSRDVIHSMYLPHMRAQMNAVPGMTTTFRMRPTVSTDSMRIVTGNPEFNYVLLCNKICGASHYNMQMDLVVESQEAYDQWMAGQTPFQAPAGAEEAPADEAAPATEEGTATEEAADAMTAMNEN